MIPPRLCSRRLLLGALSILCAIAPHAQASEPNYTHDANVIYGRKSGMALTMEVVRPKSNANGRGVVSVLSGGWYSSHPDNPASARSATLLDRGYTIFAVTHGSQPKFSIPEILEDMNRAV